MLSTFLLYIVLSPLVSASWISWIDPIGSGTFLNKNAQRASSLIDYFSLKTVGFISGFDSLYVSIGPYKAHVLDFKGTGEIPPVVLVHGLSSCAADFYPLIRCLQSECQRVLAVDLPGHGLSGIDPNMSLDALEDLMCDAVMETIKQKKLGRCILVGNSLGGFIASRVTTKMEKNVCGLVLMSPAGAPNTDQELLKMKQLFQMDTITDASSFVDKMLGIDVPFGFRFLIGWFIRERSRRPGVRAVLSNVSIKSKLTTEELKHIKCPVLLIWGRKEELFSDSHLRFFQSSIPASCLHVFRPESIGHVPHLGASMLTGAICLFAHENIVQRYRSRRHRKDA